MKCDIVSRFLKEREKDPATMTNRYLRDITLSFLIAGKDTTAGTLSWFFYLLCKHPRVEEKIFQEITGDVKARDAASAEEFMANMTDSSLNKMTYLHAAIVETLRLFPVAPMVKRMNLRL